VVVFSAESMCSQKLRLYELQPAGSATVWARLDRGLLRRPSHTEGQISRHLTLTCA
jgi:hypothetical protein